MISVVSSSSKIWLYKAIIKLLSVATYVCDTRKITAKVAQKLNVFQQRCHTRGKDLSVGGAKIERLFFGWGSNTGEKLSN